MCSRGPGPTREELDGYGVHAAMARLLLKLSNGEVNKSAVEAHVASHRETLDRFSPLITTIVAINKRYGGSNE